jgi:predicted Zn-dependent protease
MIRECLLLLLLALAAAAASYGIAELLRKPLAGVSKGIDSVPASWEVRLKDGLKKYIENDSRVVEDEVVNSAIDSIKTRLLAHVKDTTYRVEILVVESDEVNAVTFPGGLIIVFTPLIRLTSSPEELASVIAHELGHVAHRDPLRQMAKEFGVSTVLAMVNGGKPTPMVESMVKDFLDVQYTREQESAADDYGLKLLADSRINPMAFADFMEKLAPDTSADGEKSPTVEYFSTHPNVCDRIGNAKLAAKQFNAGTQVPFDLDWKALKRRLPSVFDQ